MPALPGIKIVSVQSRKDRRDKTTQILQQVGCEVREAKSAVETFSYIHEQAPDLILLDEKLEDLTALEICRSLKARTQTRPIPILLQFSASTKPETRQAKALKDLADLYLHKPVEAAELIATIRVMLRLQKVERALSESEARYQLLLEGNSLPIFIFDKETYEILSVNEAAVRHYGYSRDELQTMTMKELRPAEDIPQWTAYIAMIPNVENAHQWRHKKRDGTLIDVENTWHEIHFQERNALLALIHDITEDKQAEATLKASERRFRMLADTAPVMVWVSGTDKLFTFFNQHWLDFTGRAIDEELGNGWTEGIHPDDLDRCLEIYTTFFDAREPFTMDYRLRRADGEYRWILDKGVPRFSEDGVFEGYIGSCIDITDRKLVEGEREYLLNREQRARAEAEAANRAKDEFLAVVSHELRAPLNAMLGWSRILQYKQVDQATQVMALETIERSARIQAQIIDDLLDTARIISGKLRIEVQPINLAPVIQAAIDIMHPAAEAKGIEISTSLSSEMDIITGDSERLQQVVWNLVSNAIKFTPRDGRVEVLLRRVDPYLQIVVKDTGQGIKPEMTPYVFDRFYQVDSSSTRRYSGLGLGLSLVRHLVELHGGTISVDSAGEDQGATFTVNLPLRAVRSALQKEESFTPQDNFVLDLNLQLDDLWVLVVDDEADARELLAILLKEHGAKVTCVPSAAAAFQIIRQGEEGRRPDILVSDIGMPDEDGYTLLNRVRQLAPNSGGQIPAIALTAYGRATDRVKALAAGFQSHVPKPVDLTELIMVIASLTKGKVKGERTQAQGKNFRY
jgi:PAS domain S-box-containing protein